MNRTLHVGMLIQTYPDPIYRRASAFGYLAGVADQEGRALIRHSFREEFHDDEVVQYAVDLVDPVP